MNKILIVVLIILCSCSSGNKSVVNNADKIPDYSEIRRKHTQYVLTHNKSRLRESYKLLKKNADFKSNGLSDVNKDIVFSIYIELEKYDDLLILLSKSQNLNEYHRAFYGNYVNYLRIHCTENEKAAVFIEKNIELIKERIESSPNDSTLLVDYFFNRILIVELDSLYIELDSLKKKRNGISSEFYDPFLKETILEFSRDIPDCK